MILYLTASVELICTCCVFIPVINNFLCNIYVYIYQTLFFLGGGAVSFLRHAEQRESNNIFVFKLIYYIVLYTEVHLLRCAVMSLQVGLLGGRRSRCKDLQSKVSHSSLFVLSSCWRGR